MPAPRSPRYLLEVYGLGNPWLNWRIARGALNDECSLCNARGFIVTSPCKNRGPDAVALGPSIRCTLAGGCRECRQRCPQCHGRRLVREGVHAEDFGDEESREMARRTFPGIDIDPRPRSNMGAPLL